MFVENLLAIQKASKFLSLGTKFNGVDVHGQTKISLLIGGLLYRYLKVSTCSLTSWSCGDCLGDSRSGSE